VGLNVALPELDIAILELNTTLPELDIIVPPQGPNTPPHMTLVKKTFQTLFPPLALHEIALSHCIILVVYNTKCGTIDWHHYHIMVKPYGVLQCMRRALQLGCMSGDRRCSDRFGE